MIEVLKRVFTEEHLLLCEALPFSACSVIAPHKLKWLDFEVRSAIIFAIPYLVKGEEKRNVSRYAVSRDYHLYVSQLQKRLLPRLASLFPDAHFVLFADNSPIDERDAAVKAGIGVMGKNGLVLTEKYGSYIFLGEVLTDLVPQNIGAIRELASGVCHNCSACQIACPKLSCCLSELTQKKGTLSSEEANEIRSLGLVWGCDVCQEVCPYNNDAEETPLSFFREYRLPYLTKSLLVGMTDEEFSCRAYAWRKRDTILRNLELFESESY